MEFHILYMALGIINIKQHNNKKATQTSGFFVSKLQNLSPKKL